jgi:hypothetical protein
MIINRRTFKVKYGLEDQAAALLKETIEAFPAYTGAYRIYATGILSLTSLGVVIMEFEYDDFEAYQRLWNEWLASPGAAVYFEKSEGFFVRGGTNEIFELAASR